MTAKELAIATSTVWVVLAAVLVMFMQAGFAFLEAGLTRMKNVGHIAAKNVLIFALASLVYYLVGFGLAFGDGGNGLVGGSGFAPSLEELTAVAEAPFSWFGSIPGAAGYLFEVVFCGVSLAIVWGAMAERTKLWVYFAFGAVFTVLYSVVSHWIWSPDGWLFSLGMQDFAGSTVVHYQGALAGLAGALLLGPRIGKFDADGKPNAIPGHNMAFTTLGVLILWFGWFGFNPGSTLSVDLGGLGFFAYVALNTNLAAAAGVVGAVATSWLVIGKPDLSMMLNGAVAALVAITAACAFVAPWAAIVIGLVAGAIVVLGVLLVERARIDDPIGAIAAHGMAGVWGTLSLGLLALPSQAESLATGRPGLLYGGGLGQLGVQLLGLAAVGAFTFSVSFASLWLMKRAFGIRTDAEAETAGLDVSEHGMWGYPELYIPVPGGYGTEAHSHLGLAHAAHAARPGAAAALQRPVVAPEPSP
ncbi:MAG TPA: ammonium transporter [Gaiellaceae bacterium]|nr:ammonium transporter [Gaiellaceae bacterium]